MRIVCQQLAPAVGEDAANLEACCRAIDDALAVDAQVIVLPELCTSGYVFHGPGEVESCALTLDSSVLSDWQGRLAGTTAVLVAGVPLRADAGIVNASVMLDASGILDVYRKVHLWDQEKRWFVAGDEAPRVIDTAHGRLAMLICYDLEFPEMARGLMQQGAEVLAVPTNWPRARVPAGERPAELHDAMSSARLSHLVIACADRAGAERGIEFAGGSAVIGPDGWIRSERPQRDIGRVVADVDVDEVRDRMLSPVNHALEDRRPDVYAQMGQPD